MPLRLPKLPRAAWIGLFWLLTLSLLRVTAVGAGLKSAVVLPSLFALRAALQQTPAVDPRLKIFAYDDRSIALTGRGELEPRHWVRIVQRLSALRPRAIVIAKVFSVMPDDDPAVA